MVHSSMNTRKIKFISYMLVYITAAQIPFYERDKKNNPEKLESEFVLTMLSTDA